MTLEGSGTRAVGNHVLLVEREMITGLALAEDLLDLGFRVSGPFIDGDDIKRLLADDPPDWAIVDLAVEDGAGLMAARALTERRIPLVFFSGADRSRYRAGEWEAVPWVAKPADTLRVLAALGLRGVSATREAPATAGSAPALVDGREAYG